MGTVRRLFGKRHHKSSTIVKHLAVVCGFVCLVSQCARAEEPAVIYRCTHPHGLVEYSDRYCGTHSTPVNLAAPALTGASLGAAGDISAVVRDNHDRQTQRGIAQAERRLTTLADEYSATVLSLQQRLESLRGNALRKSNERDVATALEEVEQRYQSEQRKLRGQLKKLRSNRR